MWLVVIWKIVSSISTNDGERSIRMSDLIKRDDAIEAINKALDRETLLYGLVRKIAVDAIRSTPSADRPTWIPCSEGLPKENTEVLVSLEWGSVDIGWVRQGIWMSAYINDYEGDVLAWMPLPKPWKGADDDIH